jgi:hypothetical protein
MLPHDYSRCAGKLPSSAWDCERRNQCARYLAPAGPNGSPFVYSACLEGDGFIPVRHVKPAHPTVKEGQ